MSIKLILDDHYLTRAFTLSNFFPLRTPLRLMLYTPVRRSVPNVSIVDARGMLLMTVPLIRRLSIEFALIQAVITYNMPLPTNFADSPGDVGPLEDGDHPHAAAPREAREEVFDAFGVDDPHFVFDAFGVDDPHFPRDGHRLTH